MLRRARTNEKSVITLRLKRRDKEDRNHFFISWRISHHVNTSLTNVS